MDKSSWRTIRFRSGSLVLLVLVASIAGFVVFRALTIRQRPNVLLLTLDTTRADRLGCYGYSNALTPALDALAAGGVLFERAHTPAPLTLPSHASIMTGLYPQEHGLIVNGTGSLDRSISTLAEVLRDAGYDTAAFIGSFVLDAKFGLDRGFSHYDCDMTNTDPTEDGLHRQRDGVWVVDAALAWLRKPRRSPVFCWVHLYDAHAPYSPHLDEFGDRFKDQPYDGGLAYVDTQVQRLVRHFQQNDSWERTLVVVAGDHGEGLGDHEENEHGLTLYNSVLHVPYIWRGPGVTAAKQRISQPGTLLDLRPTLLELLKLRDPAPHSGLSLARVLTGGQISDRDCYATTDFPLLQHGWAPQRSLINASWKYIRSPDSELYDLTADPHETQNLAAAMPERVSELESQLFAIEEAMVPRHSAKVPLSTKEKRALESLGYLGGGSHRARTSVADGQWPDVKRMLPVYNQVKAAEKLLHDGAIGQAEQQLRDICRSSPDYVPAWLELANALTQQRKYDESRETSERILQRDPGNCEAHFQLGNVYSAQGNFTKAVTEFREFLVHRPEVVEVLFNLADCLVKLGQVDEAEKTLLKLLEIDPLFVGGHVRLGNLLFSQHRTDQAEVYYRTALKYSANSAEAHANLAMLLAGQRRMGEVGKHIERAVELAPQNAELQFQYGMYLLSQGRTNESLRAWEETVRLDPQHVQAKQRLEQARATSPK